MNLFIRGFVCVCVQKDRWRFQTAAVANCSRFLMMHFFSASHPDGLHATDQPNEQWSEEGMCVTPRTPHLLSHFVCVPHKEAGLTFGGLVLCFLEQTRAAGIFETGR